MADGVNKCLFVGNLGKDPEVRYSQSGAAVCSFSIGCNERRKEGDDWVNHCEWVRVVCFGKTAENVGQYLSKGRQVFVEGRMQTRSYKDKDGVEKWSTEIVAFKVLFLGGGGDGDKSAGKKAGKKKSASKRSEPEDVEYDDDLPF